MFEKPQKAQVVRIKIEAVSLHSASMAPSLDGPLLASRGSNGTIDEEIWTRADDCHRTSGGNSRRRHHRSALLEKRRIGAISFSKC
jgi:hypothetical protein